MGKIYDAQTDLTLKLETGKNLTGISNVKICYRNPINEVGEFAAVVTDETKGIIAHALTAPLAKSGEWKIWAKIVDEQGLVSIGEPAIMNVNKTGI